MGLILRRVMFATLPTHVADPLERLRSSVVADTQAKEFHEQLGADTLLQWTEHLWLNVLWLGAHLYSRFHGADHHPVVHNLILSNVPGPPIPLYFAGPAWSASTPSARSWTVPA